MKVFSLALLAMMLLIAQCRATSTNSNGTHRCDGPMDECFIIDVDLEVLLDTEINSRLLQGGGCESVTARTRGTGPAGCGRVVAGQPYTPCTPVKNQCNPYYRRKPPSLPTDRVADRVANTCGIYKGSKCSW